MFNREIALTLVPHNRWALCLNYIRPRVTFYAHFFFACRDVNAHLIHFTPRAFVCVVGGSFGFTPSNHAN